ncbi:MAG: zinc ribbon domain-containing protein, partial [Promethearchaeota archaeon]
MAASLAIIFKNSKVCHELNISGCTNIPPRAITKAKRLEQSKQGAGQARTVLRRDWQHKLSITMARTHDAILLENLNIDGIKRFNSGIAKTVTLDFSWGEFTRMLDYKMNRRGKHLVKVDRFYPSSKLCSNCDYKHDELQLSDR